MFEVIVVGGGHAGCEAAAALARMGLATLMITIDLDRIGEMSCNPAVGGIGKGHLTREIDALGGIQARVTGRAGIQFRMLNRGKGPAVQAPRVQADRELFRIEMQRELGTLESLHLYQGMVAELLVSGGDVTGVRTEDGNQFGARAVVLATGTFLDGLIHIGRHTRPAGRAGDPPSNQLARQMRELGFESGRFKTGTPPRIDGRSVDFSRFEPQHSDPERASISFWEEPRPPGTRPCWVGHTRTRTHEIVLDHEADSPLYSGQIEARGPRYCPSIEDKVIRFPQNPRHQVFLEPEGIHTTELYVNGLSTSMPIGVQLSMLQSVDGLGQARMTKPGYAIEYDYYPPHQLRASLATRLLPSLFLAGQINGTTGYEEAAAQGLVAGINAARQLQGQPPLLLSRAESYIGLLIDDLVTRGTDEPYRMFTSRSEYRLSLRQDNADLRLAGYGHSVGLLPSDLYDRTQRKLERIGEIKACLTDTLLTAEQVNPVLEAWESPAVDQPVRALKILKRPQVPCSAWLEALSAFGHEFNQESFVQVWVECKYDGYLAREERKRLELRRMEGARLPDGIEYAELMTVSLEGREKLDRVRPVNLAQAARIPGLRVSDLGALVIEIARRRSA
ncbi:MAG: tRNA uridine-5-carboxymethylaminomethyl(34) synthesis enzyme MnmG [Gemmatimonadetes bacterium]|nr:tRNA uridine-5-carboxymethylaminomethyl(34) synthesis enzyme MnmG [Gemmatimonadota bacterium]